MVEVPLAYEEPNQLVLRKIGKRVARLRLQGDGAGQCLTLIATAEVAAAVAIDDAIKAPQDLVTYLTRARVGADLALARNTQVRRTRQSVHLWKQRITCNG